MLSGKEFEADMFAVIKTGGKQYKVAKNDIISVEKLLGEPGETIEIGNVLMIGEEGKAPNVGKPTIDKATVFAEVLEQSKDDKIILFKKKRRHNYRRKRGHRQLLTVLKVIEVSATGTKTAVKAKKETPQKAKGSNVELVGKAKKKQQK
jgi:large subunit ribosomal protein L21